MDRFWVNWMIGLLIVLLVFLAAARWAYFPGDVELVRLVQAVTGENLAWAMHVTNSAKTPWNLILLVASVAFSWWLAGWRGALSALLCFVGMWLAGPALQNLIGRPRPTADIVRVSGSSAGVSFPSIFGLTYGAIFGFSAWLAWQRHHRWRVTFIALYAAILLMGLAARVALGAHWPSDVLGAYLFSLLWAAALTRLCRT